MKTFRLIIRQAFRAALLIPVGLVHAQVTTTTTLSSVTPPAPLLGQVVTLTAQVAPAAAPATVSFMDGGVLVGVGALNASGIAHVTTLSLPAGPHSLRAVYGGGAGGYQPSQSAKFSYLVTAVSGAGFAAGVAYATQDANSVAVGDFNGDGNADLAAANGTGNSVSVLLGNGNGTFPAAVNYSAGTHPQAVAAGDFNADGNVDLVVANNTSGNVSVLLGNGNGTFQAATNYAAGSGPASVAVGDFNGDGKADLVVANGTDTGGVSVLLGNGNGTFQAAVTTPAVSGASYALSVAVADFNLDGLPDLAVANFKSNNVSVLFGNGNGTFQTAVNYAAGSAPYSVSVGDFDGDGFPDLAVANSGSNNVSVLRGFIGLFFAPVNYAAGTSPASVAVGDINGDGVADLVLANSTGSNVSVLLGNGNATFQNAVNFGVGSAPAFVAVEDFNGDGRADLAVALTAGTSVSVLLATAPPSTLISLQSAPNPSQYGQAVTLTADMTPSNASGQVEFLDGTTVVGVGTLNLSGRAQITTKQLPSGTRQFHAVYNSVPGLWQPSQSAVVNQVVSPGTAAGFVPGASYSAGISSVTGQISVPVSVAVGDFNGDGKADLAVANTIVGVGSSGGYVSVLLGNGNGTFQAGVNYGPGTNPSSVAVGDFNGDGFADLAVALSGGHNISDAGVSLALGNGDGTFRTPIKYHLGSNPTAVAVADFNGDGKPDVVVGNFIVLLGNGDGTLRPGGNVAGGSVADFNGDGIADLAGANSGDGTVSISLGLGNGTFQTAVKYGSGSGSGSGPVSLAAGDFNGDGKPDLSVANFNDNNVSVLLGNGDGTFQAAVNYGAGGNPKFVTVADFDGDGKLDLAVANSAGGNVSLLRGNGNGTFQGAVNYLSGSDPESLAVGDFNGDGKVDLAVVNTAINTVRTLLGTSSITVNPAKVGVFRYGFFWVLDTDGNQQFSTPPDVAFPFGGIAGDIPITGDWNGDGHTKVGVYRSSNGLFILDYNGNGQFDAGDHVVYNFLNLQAGDVPVVGDWNGDGRTKVGLFRQGSSWRLDYNGDGVFDIGDKTYAFGGVPGDVPVVGDWTGTGTTKIGLFRYGYYWILDANGNGSFDGTGAGQDLAFPYGGISGDVPVVGDWNGDGTSKVGVFRAGFFWVLDANGNHQFDGTGAGQDLAFPFGGISGDKPVVGKWSQAASSGGLSAASVTVGHNLETPATVALSAAPTSAVPVTLTSNNPSQLLLAANSTDAGSSSIVVNIPANQQTAHFWVYGLASNGSASFLANAPGYGSTTGTVDLARSGIVIVGPGAQYSSFTTNLSQGSQSIAVYSAILDDSMNFVQTMQLAGGSAPVGIAVTSSNTSTGTITSPVTIAPGSVSTLASFAPTGVGNTTLSVSTPAGFSTPSSAVENQRPGPSIAATVIASGFVLQDDGVIGKNLASAGTVTIAQAAGGGGLPVTLTSNDRSLLLSNTGFDSGAQSITVTIPAGSRFARYYVYGLASTGSGSYTASATGFANRTSTVTYAPSGVLVEGVLQNGNQWYSQASVSGNPPTDIVVTTGVLDSMGNFLGYQALAGNPVTVSFTSSDPTKATIASPVTIPAGSGSVTARLTPLAVGNTTITVSIPTGYATPAHNTVIVQVH